MNVIFRVDASSRMGTGHVMRCLTLATELQARGVQSTFVCREQTGHLIAALRERALPVAVLPAPKTVAGSVEEDYAAWLGVSQGEDAAQTIAALRGDDPEWIVVDHYGLDVEWERALRPRAGRLLVIDDLANRTHDCDALLDQNYSEEGERRHAGLVPDRCELLVGPHYALLAPEYASYRETQSPRDGIVRRVLVYFGGADPSNMTGQALTAVSGPGLRHVAVDLVIGTNHAHRDALDAQAAARPDTAFHGTRPHLADLMVRADLAIGAGGVTTWERMCLGLPAIVVSIAENQRPTNEALAAAGLIEYVGDTRSAGAAQIHEALESLLDNRKRLTALSTRGRLLVDGRGASRVADAMLARSGKSLIRTRNALHEADARPAGFDTFSFAWIDRCSTDGVLALRNMPHVTAQMKSQGAIDKADHCRFIEEYQQRDRYDFMLIDNSRGRYVGAFYITNVGSSPEIGKYIGDADYLGKGVAHKAMQSLLDFCRSSTGLRRLSSMTRRDNARNIALNTRLGFVPSGTRGEYLVMTLEL
jgi:UDP-2,4-diacetamido-2,4,6-trideoxy-beta-L-altropyranose hydrolase